MKNINLDLRIQFLFYLNDGNVIEIKNNVFSNQISLYNDRCKGMFELYRYFIKQAQ